MQYNQPAGQLVAISPSALPTYFIKNNYTASAQEIVETYGVPRYK